MLLPMVKVTIPAKQDHPQDPDRTEVTHEAANDLQVSDSGVLLVRSARYADESVVAVYAASRWISAVVTDRHTTA